MMCCPTSKLYACETPRFTFSRHSARYFSFSDLICFTQFMKLVIAPEISASLSSELSWISSHSSVSPYLPPLLFRFCAAFSVNC